ncbi:MAG: hypothetical protein WC559_03375 [Candidatus Omnitrophota bacterium]
MKKAVLCLVAAMFVVSGCAGFSNRKDSGVPANPEILEPQVTLRFNDVPVPAGFKLLPKESYSFENAGIRVGLLKYQGKAAADQVVNFYKEQMSMYNWNLLNIIEYGDRLMNFERDSETCVINIIPRGKNVTVVISMGPKSQFPRRMEKEKREKGVK